MASETSKLPVLLLLLLLGSAIGAGWSYWHIHTVAGRYTIEQENLAECRKSADEIKRLRQRKQRALLQSKPADELNRKIDGWTSRVGIPAERVVRIDPQEPRRLADSAYLEQVTELEVFEVPLSQLIQFVQLAELEEEGLKLASMRISPPRSSSQSNDDQEVWNAELALTYLIYSPKSERR